MQQRLPTTRSVPSVLESLALYSNDPLEPSFYPGHSGQSLLDSLLERRLAASGSYTCLDAYTVRV